MQTNKNVSRLYTTNKLFTALILRSTENITSHFSENAGRNGLHFQKLIWEVIFSPVLSLADN
ncbi:MAG: hypothetical protein A2Y21_02040 [Clostridiales bacterium GWC2_40_7]|nr:MAG: hypothetical protein A2Y21_02040 [Clostridiales bacterium GWC2_40_7]